MKICYLAMYNFANEMAYDALRDHGLNILPYIINQVYTNIVSLFSILSQIFKFYHLEVA